MYVHSRVKKWITHITLSLHVARYKPITIVTKRFGYEYSDSQPWSRSNIPFSRTNSFHPVFVLLSNPKCVEPTSIRGCHLMVSNKLLKVIWELLSLPFPLHFFYNRMLTSLLLFVHPLSFNNYIMHVLWRAWCMRMMYVTFCTIACGGSKLFCIACVHQVQKEIYRNSRARICFAIARLLSTSINFGLKYTGLQCVPVAILCGVHLQVGHTHTLETETYMFLCNNLSDGDSPNKVSVSELQWNQGQDVLPHVYNILYAFKAAWGPLYQFHITWPFRWD